MTEKTGRKERVESIKELIKGVGLENLNQAELISFQHYNIAEILILHLSHFFLRMLSFNYFMNHPTLIIHN